MEVVAFLNLETKLIYNVKSTALFLTQLDVCSDGIHSTNPALSMLVENGMNEWNERWTAAQKKYSRGVFYRQKYK